MTVYDFGKVSAGELVKHSFIFTNTGDQVLEITAVQPSCGCTTAGEWSRKVEPGKTGMIPLQFNSANFSGPVTKHATVSSNDKAHAQTALQIKGTVWRPIEVTPQFAVLNVMPEAATNPPTKVRIVNNLETPLDVWSVSCNNTNFTVDLQTNKPGKEFEIAVAVIPSGNAGNMQGQINVKTSSTNTPVLNISAWANVQAVIAINPPQIVLPGGPLATKMTPSVFIQNNGTNQISISDPAVSIEGVEVELKEMAPARSYTAKLTFPQGFELTPGKPAEMTLKSTHPKYAVLKVPIMQMPRPANQLAAATNQPAVRPIPVPVPGTAPGSVKAGLPQSPKSPPPSPPGVGAQ
jgi:hypothetical protein